MHLFWCLLPSWRFGGYYDYGYLVPVIALGFAWRRAGVIEGEPSRPWQPRKAIDWLMVAGVVLFMILMIPMRIIGTGDPEWRPLIVLHGVLLSGLTHLVLARSMGWRHSAYFLPITIFAWSAVPYLSQIEQFVVRHLTGWVIGITREIFLLGGAPVEKLGERLTLGDQIVDVTEGCSGIRSIQSLVMAALFFGELLWLRLTSRVMLLGMALVAALVCNTGRAWYLAKVQFSEGLGAAQAVHDMAGHVAFGAAAAMLLGAALVLSPRRRGRAVVRRAVGSESGAVRECVPPSH
jgi:exosortase